MSHCFTVRSLAPEQRRRRILELHADDPPWIHACVQATPEILGPWPLHEVATLEETRFNGLKRECGIHEINLADL